MCTVCVPVDFVVGVVEADLWGTAWCGDDDLLLNEIFVVWTGDICEDAEFIDARLMVISPSVLPNVVCDGVGECGCVCECVCEAAAWTIVRRLISRFPNAACFRGSHCSSEGLHSTCTGWAVAVCPPYRPVFAFGVLVVVSGFGEIF